MLGEAVVLDDRGRLLAVNGATDGAATEYTEERREAFLARIDAEAKSLGITGPSRRAVYKQLEKRPPLTRESLTHLQTGARPRAQTLNALGLALGISPIELYVLAGWISEEDALAYAVQEVARGRITPDVAHRVLSEAVRRTGLTAEDVRGVFERTAELAEALGLPPPPQSRQPST